MTSSHITNQIDLLSSLYLPDRYERLRERVGAEIANLLVPPAAREVDALAMLAQEIATRDEGILIPIFGNTGTGKTTFAANLSHWAPSQFTPTLEYDGTIDFNGLAAAVSAHARQLPANDRRIVPVNIDHRESNPPTDAELAAIKRFLRTRPGTLSSLVLWPETNEGTAREIARRYVEIAGEAAIELPLVLAGPDRSTWRDIAINTLRIANNIESLDTLGVDPSDYDPGEFRSLGDYLRRLSRDFNRLLQELRQSIQKPIKLAIVFVSETPEPGVLSQITNSTHYGLLDAQSLVAVTPESAIGKWWSNRRGLLTRAIVQLNAHAFSLTPATSVSIVRNCGPAENEILDTVGLHRHGAGRAARDLARADLGKFLMGQSISRFETRGTPAENAGAAYQLLADAGFTYGKDKELNAVLAVAIRELLSRNNLPHERVSCEEKLPFANLIPDNAVHYDSHVVCIEYTWRKGDFLASGNRSSVAQYILTKLQNYVRDLGWTAD